MTAQANPEEDPEIPVHFTEYAIQADSQVG
jgi:hypothetical protein